MHMKSHTYMDSKQKRKIQIILFLKPVVNIYIYICIRQPPFLDPIVKVLFFIEVIYLAGGGEINK